MKSQKVSESRKIRKPMMEKKRRARINDSLETLKEILLETKANFKEDKKSSRNAKLEKADILEMTVKYLQQLHGKLKESQRLVEDSPGKPGKGREPVAIKPADSSTGSVTLLPTRLNSGHVVYFLPGKLTENCRNQSFSEATEKVWRPW